MSYQDVPDKWLVIVNPNAGNLRVKKDWPVISALLEKYSIKHDPYFTACTRHAILLTQQGIEKGYRKIIGVGGDGTMNEIVNGAFTQSVCLTREITLAMITVGTGNDWGKMFGIPRDYEAAVKVIQEGKIRLQDTGLVYFFQNLQKESRYFINIAGLGFDAVVVKRTNRQKEHGHKGKLIYLANLLISMLSYKFSSASLVIDDEKVYDKIFTISVGIGKYSGGGMMQTPMAIPDDGLFDVTVIKKISKTDIVMSLKMLYDGSLLNHPKISAYKCSHIFIDADPLMHLEADGETLGHSPVEFEIIPQSINIIYSTFPQ
jgi:YegS/Rv2252/BmrU family lipid kinase